MTSETPCLPGCGCVCGHDNDWHAVAVGACRSREHCNCSKFVARAHAPNCPNAKPAEPQSEPPIADGVGVGIANLFMGHEAETAGKVLARAYLSLKAERDALRAENAAKYEEIASERHSYILLEAERQRLYDGNAALKARMEELSESLLWATSSYEERVVILANREKRKEGEHQCPVREP